MRVCEIQVASVVLFCRVLSVCISKIALKLYKASHLALSFVAGWTVVELQSLFNKFCGGNVESYEATPKLRVPADAND